MGLGMGMYRAFIGISGRGAIYVGSIGMVRG